MTDTYDFATLEFITFEDAQTDYPELVALIREILGEGVPDYRIAQLVTVAARRCHYCGAITEKCYCMWDE